MITDSAHGRIFEVTRTGEIVWAMNYWRISGITGGLILLLLALLMVSAVGGVEVGRRPLGTDPDQVDDVMKGIAKRNNLSMPAFKQQLKAQGTDIHSMRNRLRANMSWMRLVNAKFGRFVDVSQKTIDESVA